jgi:uncharacterized membrane protein YoaT (DUF817 family)
MQAAFLIVVYVVTTIVVQFVGFLISLSVQYEFPTAGLLTFLAFFLAAFGIAWPIAVRIAEWSIVKAGYKLHAPDPRAV